MKRPSLSFLWKRESRTPGCRIESRMTMQGPASTLHSPESLVGTTGANVCYLPSRSYAGKTFENRPNSHFLGFYPRHFERSEKSLLEDQDFGVPSLAMTWRWKMLAFCLSRFLYCSQ